MNRPLALARAWIKFTWYFLYSIRIRRPWAFPPHTWILLYLRGFLPNKLDMYKFRENNWRLYINDRQILLTAYLNREYGIVIDDKYLSTLVLQPIVRIPETYAFIKDRRIYPVKTGDDPSLASLVREKGKTILKPTDKNCGQGISVLEFREGSFFRNNEPINPGDLETLPSEQGIYILSEYVQQSEFASRLYPETVNTVRIITMIDPESGDPFITGAVQKAGSSRSYPVDNLSAGGMSGLIDLPTGRLGKVKMKPFNWLDVHPDTGLRLEGLVIPNWEELKSEILRLAGLLSAIPYIAWDIALVEDGICVIETNSWTELCMLQLDKPLCSDPAIRKFFRHHGINRY